MWKMLERLHKEHDVKKSAVFRAVFPKCEDNPTKYLSQLATASGGQLPANVGTRNFRPISIFFERSRRIGQMRATSWSKCLLKRSSGGMQRSADSRHVKLMQDLCLVMNGVARKTDLQKYFRAVRDFGGIFTPTIAEWQAEMDGSWSEHQVAVAFELFGDERQHWPIELERPAREAEDGNGDSIAAYPLVDLGSWEIGGAFPIAIAANVPAEDGSRAEISGTVLGRTLASLHLCIIPTGSELEPTPALRVALTTRLDALTEVVVHGEAAGAGDATLRELLSFPWNNIPAISRGTTLIPARIPAGSIDCECRATVDTDVLPEPFSDYFPPPDAEVQRLNWAAALRFFPLTGFVCLDWFRLPLGYSLRTSLRTASG